MSVIMWLVLATLPIAVSMWGLLDVAKRPAWAWSLAGRSQLGWLTAIAFGLLFVILGPPIALYYLWRVRPHIAAIEAGDMTRLTESL